MAGSAPQWNCQFKHRVVKVFARSSIVICDSARADRNVMAVSRLLGTAAACVVQLSFGAGHRKTYWNVCIKAAIVICHEIFSILALAIFLFKFLLKMLQNRLFFFGVEIRFWSCSLSRLCT